MKKDKICVALVGAGWAGAMHAKAYNHIYGLKIDLKTVCALEPTIPEFAEKYNFRTYTKDFNDVISDAEIDVIDIVTPPNLHKSMIISAMEAGKDVICEKPLTGYFGLPGDIQPIGDVSKRKMLDEVRNTMDEIEQVMKKTGRKFFYSENWIYAPAFLRACELMLDKGTTIVQMSGTAGHKGSQAGYVKYWDKSGGGTLSRNLIHPLSTAIFAKRKEMESKGLEYGVKSVYCDCSQIMGGIENRFIEANPVDTEDWAHAIITFNDGTKATLTAADTFVGEAVNVFEMFGNDASFKCKFSQSNLLDVYFSDDKGIENSYFVEKNDSNIGHHAAIVDEEIIRGYYGEIQDFLECIAYDRDPIVGFALAKEATELIQIAYLSAEQKKTIEISNL